MLEFLSEIMDFFHTTLNQTLFDLMTQLIQFCASGSNSFWENGFVTALINISVLTALFVFAVSFIIALFDVAEAAAEEKPVYVSSMIADFVKAFVFAGAAPYIGLFAMQLMHSLLLALNWSSSLETIFVSTTGLILSVVSVIAAVAFFFLSMKNSGLFFCQLLTCPLYVPSISRGDHSAMGAWMRLSVSILMTYFFQYLLFYCGLYLAFNGDFMGAIMPWCGMFGVSRVLDKYGFSAGSGGIGQTANLALQGAMVAFK